MIRNLIIITILGFCTSTAASSLLSGVVQKDVQYSLTEIKLGRQFIRSARSQLAFVSDPEIASYIEGLGDRLLGPTGLSRSKFQFSVIDDDNLNAFAVPGGWISVHTGLITRTDSESELASVLAHEIAHITQRHLPRTFERAEQRTLPAVAAMMGAILVGGQIGSAALVGANAAVVADQLKYSREFEKEADAIGLELLSKGEFDVHAMPRFFLKLQKTSELHASNVPEYLRTHPLSISRIADSESRVGAFPATEVATNAEFLHIRARIKALSGDSSLKKADMFRQQIIDSVDAEKSHLIYGEAMAAMKVAQYDRSRGLIESLLIKNPDSLRYGLGYAQIELSAGNISGALRRLEKMRDSFSDHPVVLHYYAEALLAAQQFTDARRVLRQLERKTPNNANVHSMMSRVNGELGHLAQAFMSRAQFFILRYRLPEAEKELVKALEHAGESYYLRSSIEAKQEEINDLMRRYDERPKSIS